MRTIESPPQPSVRRLAGSETVAGLRSPRPACGRLPRLGILLLAALILLLAGSAQAQSLEALGQLAPVPTDETAADVRDRVARLSDSEVRALLLERLDREAAAQAAEPSGLGAARATLMQAAQGFATSLASAVARMPNIASGIG